MSRPATVPPVAPTTIVDVDESCLPATGLRARPWRRALDELGVPYARVGRRRVVVAADWQAAIRRASGAAGEALPLADEGEIIRLAAAGSRRRAS